MARQIEKEWFAKDGSVYVIEKTVQPSIWRSGSATQVNEAIAFNVGDAVAKHLVEIHNAHVRSNHAYRI